MDFDEVLSVASAINSETRLRYVSLLSENELSTRELQNVYNTRYNESIRRESVHRGLEELRDATLLTRTYDEEHNHFKYALAVDRIEIELRDGTITVQ